MIQLKNVTMKFKLRHDKVGSFKEYVISMLKGSMEYEDITVLRDISFDIKKGEIIGIIGKNGAGKSTLLKIICGIMKPTKGEVKVKSDSISSLIELGAGFDGDLSGRENIYLNGAILGYSKDFLDEKYKQILEFSELEKFIDSPVRNYSTGMFMRLAFSIATTVKPEILIIDEVLAVGDEKFQEKSRKRILELMDGGTTVLLVSHNLTQITELCERVIWLEDGQVKMFDEAEKVCKEYKNF